MTQTFDQADAQTALTDEAKRLGFDSVAITCAPLPVQYRQRLREFIDAGHHGEMSWLADRVEQRSQPGDLWSDVNSIIMLGVNYAPSIDPLTRAEKKSHGNISVYALNQDYHDVIKKNLKQLARWLVKKYNCDVKVFVDTAPVMEKPLAQQAGIGWQGKHTNLVSREFGSWLFLGAIYTTLEFGSISTHKDHCGACSRCINICPTDAFPAPYKLDARKCISYLTIEHKGPIPRAYRRAIGNRIYGCDDCLAVCPWNKFAIAGRETKLMAREELLSPLLSELAELDDARFRALFKKSPVKRIGRDRFVRNVAIAMGNSGNTGFVDPLETLIADESLLVRGASIWALSVLSPERASYLKNQHMPAEHDQSVIEEWEYVGSVTS